MVMRVEMKNAFRKEHAPRILAALVSRNRNEWQIWDEDDQRRIAVTACDLTDALWIELCRRWDDELKEAHQPPRPEPSSPIRKP